MLAARKGISHARVTHTQGYAMAFLEGALVHVLTVHHQDNSIVPALTDHGSWLLQEIGV